MESRAAHTHPKNTQVPPPPGSKGEETCLSSQASSTDWRESFVPEPSSRANYLLNFSITSDVAHLKWLTK